MGYNDSKIWLDEQGDIIKVLVQIAREDGISELTFNSSRDALYYQFFIRNILRGLAIHYPAYADVAQAVRTWRTNNYDANEFTVHVGTESNYQYKRKGTTHTKRKLPPPKVRGRPPEPVRPSVGYGLVPGEFETLKEELPSPTNADVFEYTDPFNMSTIPDVIKPILNVVEMRHSQLIVLSNVDLSVKESKAFVDALENFTHDDSFIESGRVKRLILRRRSSAAPT